MTADNHIVRFPQLSYKSFAYEGDEQALEAVKNIPGASKLFHWIIDNLLEEYIHLNQLYNNIRVNNRSYPSIYNIVKDCAHTLDCPVPEVFLAYSPIYNASTFGVDRVYISLNSYLVEDFSHDELVFVIGHELGHIKAGHVLYKTVTTFIIHNLPILQSLIPFNIGLFYQPLLVALFEWYRRAEFTCDRAGLLCAQNLNTSISSLSRFAGRLRKYPNEWSIESQLNQVSDVAESKHKLVKLFLFMDNIDRSHPYPTMRLKQLTKWYNTGAYNSIISGDYIKDAVGEHELGKRNKCRGCGVLINSKLSFCPKCGVSQIADGGVVNNQLLCPACGASVSSANLYCTSCGEKL